MTTETAQRPARVAAPEQQRRVRPIRILLHAFLIVTALSFLAPLLWTVYTSFRPYADTAERGYFSLAGTLNVDNYVKAWTDADMPQYYFNTLLVTVPGVVITLLLASFVAFGISRFSWRGNIALLILFTAGNLLPPQILLIPLYRLYLKMPLPWQMSESELLYDSYWGIILIHVAFQIGFCTFVLSNYMKTLPIELTEAAIVDGASVWRQYWQVILPLCKPAMAALGTLEFTWIYNDLLWALVLLPTGEKKPIVAGLQNLGGLFFKDDNLIAAGSMLAAIPTLIVYFALQRHFIGGLTLGGTKG